MSGSSFVLCIPSELFDSLGRFQGLCTEVSRYYPKIITPPHFTYIQRSEAENDPGYKQIIPYVILMHEDSIFVYKRGKRGRETRLHHNYSLGIGGHIEADDALLWSKDDVGYEDAMWREVTEEIHLNSAFTSKMVGLINDDSDSVGQVHLGLVHLVRLEEPRVEKKEATITDPGFMPLAEAAGGQKNFENWSRICLDHFDLLLANFNRD